MTTLKNLPSDDLNMLMYVVQQSFSVRRHFQLFNWLQDEVQQFLPHEIMIAAWGDFQTGEVFYDIISPLPGVRTGDFDSATVLAFMTPLLLRWYECGHTPYILTLSGGFAQARTCNPRIDAAMARMQACLIHGIKDQRGGRDCIYALLGPTELARDRSKLTMRFMLPYIDTALRQVVHLPAQQPNDDNAPPIFNVKDDSRTLQCGMSLREYEIMNWVCMGKTNQEIGTILEISPFTVKNHMQRIFKKLNVMNRAQAAAKIDVEHRHATQ